MMEDLMRVLFVVLVLFGFLSPAFSGDTKDLDRGFINRIYTGYGKEQFMITLRDKDGKDIKEPEGKCINLETGKQDDLNTFWYQTTPRDTGYTTYYAAALSAYLANEMVTVIISTTDCIGVS
jgi:hypothetical protein